MINNKIVVPHYPPPKSYALLPTLSNNNYNSSPKVLEIVWLLFHPSSCVSMLYTPHRSDTIW